MIIWNVHPVLNTTGKIKYMILPYNLKGVIRTYLKPDKLGSLPDFIKNSRLSEEAAEKYAEEKSKYYQEIDN